MNKKICMVALIFVLLSCVFTTQKTFAKYIMSDKKQMSVYIDKTPPTITITTPSGDNETYDKTKDDVIKKTEDVTVDTDDNIKIDHNEIRYNPTENKFDDKTPENFDDGKELTEEGYYEITAVDTSGNTTKIVILLDKSAPDVTVRFYKKGEVSVLKNNIQTNMNGGVCV